MAVTERERERYKAKLRYDSLARKLAKYRKEYYNIQNMYPPESELLHTRLAQLNLILNGVRKEIDVLHDELYGNIVHIPLPSETDKLRKFK